MANIKYVTREFETETLKALLYEDLDEDAGYEIVTDEIYDTSRWSNHYNLIFSFEGKFYQVQYSRGATECQDEQPFEYEGAVMSATEMTPREVTTIKFVAVKA